MSNRLKSARATDDKTDSPKLLTSRKDPKVIGSMPGSQPRTYPSRYNAIALLSLLALACLVAGFSMWVILRHR